MTVAQDILGAPGSVGINEGTVFVHDGKLDATYSIKNILMRLEMPFNPDVTSRKDLLVLYGATTPQGAAEYASAEIGTVFILTSITTDAISAAALFIKTASGASGWSQVGTSITAPSHVIIAGGLHNTVGGSATETITVALATIGDYPLVNIVSVGTVGGYVAGATISSAGFITVTMSADQKVSCKLAYRVMRAVAA
jgi:hypothetical protein